MTSRRPLEAGKPLQLGVKQAAERFVLGNAATQTLGLKIAIP